MNSLTECQSIPRWVCTTVFLFMIIESSGQPGDPTPPVPITGIEWLLAAGAALGIKKYLDSKRKK